MREWRLLSALPLLLFAATHWANLLSETSRWPLLLFLCCHCVFYAGVIDAPIDLSPPRLPDLVPSPNTRRSTREKMPPDLPTSSRRISQSKTVDLSLTRLHKGTTKWNHTYIWLQVARQWWRNGNIFCSMFCRTDFIKHPTNRPFFHQPEEYIKPQGAIDSMTSYKKDYIPKDAMPPKPIKRDDGKRIQGKFEGDPTYRSTSLVLGFFLWWRWNFFWPHSSSFRRL